MPSSLSLLITNWFEWASEGSIQSNPLLIDDALNNQINSLVHQRDSVNITLSAELL